MGSLFIRTNSVGLYTVRLEIIRASNTRGHLVTNFIATDNRRLQLGASF